MINHPEISSQEAFEMNLLAELFCREEHHLAGTKTFSMERMAEITEETLADL